MLVYDENSPPMARRDAGHALKSPRGRTHDVVVAPVGRFELVPQGPFDLEVEARRFGGWPRHGDAVVMAFSGGRLAGLGGGTDAPARKHYRRRRSRHG